MVRMVYFNGACYLVGRRFGGPRLVGVASRMVGIYQGTGPTQGTKIIRYYA